MLTRQEAAKQRQQQQQQQQQKAAALQNRPDNMLGASGGTASWASLCEQAPQPGGRYYQPQDQQQQGYSGSGGLPPQQPVLNLAKVGAGQGGCNGLGAALLPHRRLWTPGECFNLLWAR